QEGDGFVVTHIYETLTRKIPLDFQLDLGIAQLVTKPDGTRTVEMINKSQLDYVNKRISDRLDYGPGSAPDLEDDERDRRRQVLTSASAAALDVFDFGWDSNAYAIDAPAVWSWGRGRRRPSGAPQPHDGHTEAVQPTPNDTNLP